MRGVRIWRYNGGAWRRRAVVCDAVRWRRIGQVDRRSAFLSCHVRGNDVRAVFDHRFIHAHFNDGRKKLLVAARQLVL